MPDISNLGKLLSSNSNDGRLKRMGFWHSSTAPAMPDGINDLVDGEMLLPLDAVFV
jgi:hypothetical protein